MISEEIVHINGIPKKAVVFLHGYQDAAEHIERKTELLQTLDDVALHIPQAPFVNEVDPQKRQWYSIHQFDPDDKRRSTASFNEFADFYNRMTLGLEESNYLILQYVDNLLQEYGLGYEDLFLCGFSQGAMCALYSGLMSPYRMGGVISFSGILAAKGFVERHFRSTPDILLIHGRQDDKIRFEASDFSADILHNLGCSVETYDVDAGRHKITPEGVEAAKQFILKHS
jgi:predicted esterase